MSLILLAVVVVVMICLVVALDRSPCPQPAKWMLGVLVILVGAAFICMREGWLR